MAYRQFYIFVEGPDDKNWVEAVLRQRLEIHFDIVKVISFATTPKAALAGYLQVYGSQASSDYLIIADLDAVKRKWCITRRKKDLENHFGLRLDPARVLLAQEMIESWYMAGIGEDLAQKHRIKVDASTTAVTKDSFERALPKGIANPLEYKQLILAQYDLNLARQRNPSLDRLFTKHFLFL